MVRIVSNYFFLIMMIVFISSCKKDSPVFPEGFGPGQPNIFTYQPLIKNSTWTYIEIQGADIKTSTQTMTGNTATFSGTPYYEAISKRPGNTAGDKIYYHLSNHVYKLRSDKLSGGLITEFEYLNDTAKVNSTWTRTITDDGSVNGFDARMVGTVKEKDITKVVNGITFRNVIHTQLVLQYDLIDGFEDAATYDFYIAKAIGVIQVDSKVTLYGANVTASTQLKTYSIK